MIYIWVRATTDWENERAFQAQLRPDLKPAVNLWDETFTIPFHLFRHRVREIARMNLSRVDDAVCVGWKEIPEGAIAVPVDDDDWFAPNLAAVLEREYATGVAGFYWISSFLQVPVSLRHKLGLMHRAIFRRPPLWICESNNYAVVNSPQTKALLRAHTQASEWFQQRAGRCVKKIDERLSVMNRTLGSRTSLRPFPTRPITRPELIRKFVKYKTLYSGPRAPDLAWCRPYLAMMSGLMDELRLREPSKPRVWPPRGFRHGSRA
jgi:hypothetical protein